MRILANGHDPEPAISSSYLLYLDSLSYIVMLWPHLCFIIANRNFLGASPSKLLCVFLILHIREIQAHCRTLLIPCEMVYSFLYVCDFSIPSYYLWRVKMYPLLPCFVILCLVAIHILPSKQEAVFHNSTKQLVKLLLCLNFCVLECRC
jgi:hypothetical protein